MENEIASKQILEQLIAGFNQKSRNGVALELEEKEISPDETQIELRIVIPTDEGEDPTRNIRIFTKPRNTRTLHRINISEPGKEVISSARGFGYTTMLNYFFNLAIIKANEHVANLIFHRPLK